MTLDRFRAHCLAKPGVTEDLPFGPETLVFRVGGGEGPGKIFALTGLDTFESINLKCDPERAIDLRERYPGITPGYHMNKQHWNTVTTDGSVPDPLLLELADHSYDRVRRSLPKREREALARHSF
ncbi:MAG: MmcQ/YjbR family DNA-binding protein [Flavobacteriales bacterium]|nr:MmcQ/YjbR family DNA-binding protein [Flavobacteriales bacterium]MCB9193975.1 MmcQ/YjbR family DNA-binding protein [Flavobacteriales bacterium]